MKRILLAVTMLVLVLPAIKRAGAEEVSVDFFYNNLSGGNWIETDDYGYGWQPDVAMSDPRWRPYADGYWAYTDVGWTWVSYEDFGSITYHYGRWARLADQGWVWFPGDNPEWGPAWVSWRTGGDYVGWAPLPPRGREVVYEGQPITGHVDVEFDIGPAYYNFVDVRYIGEPVLRERIFESSQNVTYVNKTVNVTNITYNNSTVYNYGPDYETINRYSTRPIQRLSLQRETNVDASVAFKSGGFTKVRDGSLVISAPMRIQKSAQPVAPKNVKIKVAQAKIEHGWSGLSDPKAQADLKQKMQTEDAKNVAPPTVQPRAGAGGNAPNGVSAARATSPAPMASPSVNTSPAASPLEKSKGKRKGISGEQNVSPSPSASIASSAPQMERGKGFKNKHGEHNAPAGTPGASISPSVPATESTVPMERGKGRKGKQGEPVTPGGTPNTSTSSSGASESAGPGERGHKGKHAEQNVSTGSASPMPPPPSASGAPESNLETSKGKNKTGRSDLTGQPPVSGAAPGTTNAASPERHKAQQLPTEKAGQGEKAKGKKKGDESPTPGPQ